MYEFLDRLVSVAMPRIRDFRGISVRAFDGRGNYNMGVKEQIIFPEIEYDKIDAIRGMNITISTTAKTDAEAKALWGSRRDAMVSTNHVIGESWTFLRRRAGHQPAVAFLDAVERSTHLAVVHADQDLEIEAARWLRRHDEREYSFVDAVSFAFMRRRRLAEALAFDGDFAAAGFVELRA